MKTKTVILTLEVRFDNIPVGMTKNQLIGHLQEVLYDDCSPGLNSLSREEFLKIYKVKFYENAPTVS